MILRQPTVIMAKVAATFVLLWLVLRGIDVHSLAERLNKISPGWLFTSVLAGFMQMILHAQRWRSAVVAAGIKLGMFAAFRYCMIGMFFNQMLPSGVGGDAARIWFLGRQSGWQRAAYSAMVDRGFGLLGLATLIVLSLPFSLKLMSGALARVAIIIIGGGALTCCLVFVLFGLFRWPWIDRFAMSRHLHSCAELAARLLFDWRTGPWMIAASVGIHTLSPLAAYAAGRSIQADVGLFQMLLLVPPVMMVAMLPASVGGWGLREASMAIAFTSAGLAQADGFMVSLLLGLSQFLVGSVGCVLWVSMPKNALADAKQGSAAP